MKYIFTIVFLSILLSANAQYKNPKLQVYVSQGLFLEQLSNDDLIPHDRQRDSRLGDEFSFGLKFDAHLKNKRFSLGGGVGLNQKHYSINKYSVFDLIGALFLFDSPNRGDTFSLSYIRFTNNYLQVPLSTSYTITTPYHNFQLAVGLNIKPEFLVNHHALIVFDSTYKIPQTSDVIAAKKTYTANASDFLISASPYFEASFNVQKQLGLSFQFNLPSYYSTPLDKRLTTSTIDLFSFTFGAFYSLK